MNFNDFANILHSVLADGKKTDEFTKELFLNIVEYSDDEDNLVENLTLPTFKSYFNGRRSISNIAKKINAHIETELFVAFINSFAAGAISNLCDALAAYRPDITLYNTGEVCADLFKQILIEAASIKKHKNTTPVIYKSGSGGATDEVRQKYETRLLVESKGLCPNDNCCRPLYISANGQTGMNYKITQIDPNLPPDSYKNLIALCPDCSKKYLLLKDNNQIHRLKKIKEHLINKAETIDILANTQVEEGVERVLRKISNTPALEVIPLGYEPVRLYEKILPVNRTLLIKAKAYVTEYYPTVHGIFQQLSKERKLHFDSFCMQVKINYIYLRDNGRTQPEIFDALVEWLASNTNDRKDLCEIVISYFIQKCEVFDAITE
ncbi:MAG: hypothetical protein HGJ97_18840 [Desulfosporosinus sp.]|nr:hypothetical protein [Desulfosporosinus sp.]